MLNGIIPPLPTPFLDSRLDREALCENVETLNATRLSGYLVLGSNGESPYLSYDEKLAVIETVAAAKAPDKVLIAGTGLESIRETIRLTNDAADLGAAAALVLTPSFYLPAMTHEALCHYFRQVADESRIPILIYNVPRYTGIQISPQTVAALAAHDNISGIKSSSTDIAHLAEIIQQAPAAFSVFAGTGSILYAALCLGAHGGILALANIAARECVRLLLDVRKEDHRAARKRQLSLLAVNKAVTATWGVSGLKAAMNLLGYRGGEPRGPLQPLSPEGHEQLRGILADAGLLRSDA